MWYSPPDPPVPNQHQPSHAIVLYSKPGCHLCDVAHAVLERLGEELPLTIETVDITSDPELGARYRYRIPVVVAGAAILAEGKVTEYHLRLKLHEFGWIHDA